MKKILSSVKGLFTPPPPRCNDNTWLESFEYDKSFKERYEKLLNLLPRNYALYKKVESVLDLGCGVQYLREVIESKDEFKGCVYSGVDLYAHKSDNIICDFNKKQLPALPHSHYDLIVCAGLLEYIYDMKFFIDYVAKFRANYILCSYNFGNLTDYRNEIWTPKLYTQGELFTLFFKHKYSLLYYHSDMINESAETGYFLFINKWGSQAK